MPPAKKKDKPAPKGKGNGKSTNLFEELAQELSAKAPVLVAGSESGGIHIRLPGVISTRCPTLDAAIGRGGIPMARLTVVAGTEAGGKTTLALHTAAECQSMGGIVIYVDNEHKLDLDYAQALGVDLNKLLLTQPGTLEGSLDVIARTANTVHARDPDKPVLAVLDSMNASKSQDEYEDNGTANFTETRGMAFQARVMSSSLPKLVRQISGKKVALLFISQPRQTIGMMSSKNLVACGNAPKFYAAVVIELIRLGFLKESEKAVGTMMKAKVIKNQVAVPFREAEFNLRWGLGIDYHHALLQRSIQLNLLNSSAGGWYDMPWDGKGAKDGRLKWQGNRGWNKLITQTPEVLKYLEEHVRDVFQ